MTPASIPHVGLPADELLKMQGRSTDHILTWPSKVVGQDAAGLLVDWDYSDIIVHLHYKKGRYRVASIEENHANSE